MSAPDPALPSGRAWIAAFAAALGVAAPDDETIERLLALAGTAAHASERIAAPIACYLVATAGIDVTRAQQIATGLDVGGAGQGAGQGAGR